MIFLRLTFQRYRRVAIPRRLSDTSFRQSILKGIPMIFRTSWATVALILATTTASAQAGLVLDIGSTTIASGGTGFVDLTITTDGTDTSLGQYNFDVVIDGAGTHNA